MTVNAMRRVDRWVGVPICLGLTLLRRLRGLFPAPKRGAPRRILLVKLAEQGATVLAYSAIRMAVASVGRQNVFFLVFAENRFILDLLDVIPRENVIQIRTDGLFRTIRESLRAVWRIRRLQIDSAVDMEFFARSSAIFTYLSGAVRRAGFHAFAGEASYRGDLMTHRLSFNPFLHVSQTFKLLVQSIHHSAGSLPAWEHPLPPDEPVPLFNPEPHETEAVKRLVQEILECEAIPPLILLNANCSDLLPLRRWPPRRNVELAHRLLERYPEIAILFTGAPAEAAEVERLVQAIGSKRCRSVAGRTTLRQLIVLYGLADVMVTNDSGPAHYAALAPIDVITLFGPETPAAFGATTLRSHILWAGLPCSPCINAYNDRQSPCRNNVCMQRISVEEVYQRVCEVYELTHEPPLSTSASASRSSDLKSVVNRR